MYSINSAAKLSVFINMIDSNYVIINLQFKKNILKFAHSKVNYLIYCMCMNVLKKSGCIVLLLLLLAIPTWASVRYSADNTQIVFTGRVDNSNPAIAKFVYPGTAIYAVFTGSSIKAVMKPAEAYYMVEIDNIPAYKIASSKKDSIMTIATDLQPGKHTLKLTLVSEAYHQRPEFHAFLLDDGAKLTGKPKMPKRKIEFIGNSITCGYGVEADNARSRFSDSNSNHYYSYPAIAARAFGAQTMVVARSGIGIYRNYNGPKNGSKDNMRDVYENILYTDYSKKWDFSKFKPDVVCVNLGTNDTSTNPYDVMLIIKGYREFLKTLRGHYPKAKIVFVTGSMLNDKSLEDVTTILDLVVAEAKANGDDKVYRIDLTPSDGSLGYGADWHPSISQNVKSSEEFITALESITGWKRKK